MTGYTFDDALPIEPIAPGTTVLVSGPALSGAEDLALSMITDGANTGDGMLFISTNMTCQTLLNSCHRMAPAFDPESAAVIDCSGQDIGDNQPDVQIRSVSTQSDLTGIGMRFSSLYESLYGRTSGRVRTGLLTLSSLSMYVDFRSLYRFAQTLAGRVGSADGLGVFAIDPATHDEQSVNTLNQVVDGRIDVRETDGETELRIRGLPDQPSGWQSVDFDQ